MTTEDPLTCEGCQIRDQDRDRLRALAERLMGANDRHRRTLTAVCAERDDALRKLAELEESVVTKESAPSAAEPAGLAAILAADAERYKDDLRALRRAELTPDITVVTGPPDDDGVFIHPSTTGDVEDWLQARGYRWLWIGFDGHTLLLCLPGQPVTMARIGDRLRWASNRVRVEG